MRAEACPAVTDVELRYDVAQVSVTVTSQMAFFPACQGVSVRSLEHSQSVRDRPAGFLIEEMPARPKSMKNKVDEETVLGRPTKAASAG